MNPVLISNERRFFSFTVLDEKGEEHDYSIPLLTSLPASYSVAVSKLSLIKDEDELTARFLELQVEVFKQYAPDLFDIASTLDMKSIFQLWRDASTESGADLGESSASPE